MRRRPLSLLALAVLALLIADGAPARAAKWVNGCPTPRRLSVFKVGQNAYATSPFVHVGHDVTLRLKEVQVERYGGFSTEPDGNTIELAIVPPDSDPIPLPPITATAVSLDTLRFPAPDTRPLLGRLLVGPLGFVVKRGDVVVVDSSKARFPVILPPMNDVHALTEQDGEVEVLAAVDRSGKRVWVPLTFGAFGSAEPMPSCPAEMTPIVAFAADFSLKEGEDQLVPHASFTKLKKTRLHLGDFDAFGVNLYGQRIKGSLNVDRTKGKAVVLCNLNDTLDLVMMLPLKEGAGREKSHVVPLVRDGSPLVLKFRNISADPEIAPLLSGLTRDSIGAPCATAP